MNDPIVDEVRRIRDAHAARFKYDLDAIYRDIKEREKESGLVFVDGVARQPVPSTTLQLAEAGGLVPSEIQPSPTAVTTERESSACCKSIHESLARS
jgi:hypothetical protein